MASKDELRKQQRTLARRPRTNVPSYTMDSTGELKHEPTNVSVEKPIEPIKPIVKEVQTSIPSTVDEPKIPLKEEATETVQPKENEILKDEAKKTENLVVANNTEENTTAEELVVAKKETKSSAITKKKASLDKEDVVKSVTVRLVDIDDADFLKYACKVKGMNMQEFFWSLLEEDIKSNKKIDPRDAEHIEYKSIALPEIRTIPIPKSLKEKVGINSGLHRLPETRYMAMVVHRARLANPAWN